MSILEQNNDDLSQQTDLNLLLKTDKNLEMEIGGSYQQISKNQQDYPNLQQIKLVRLNDMLNEYTKNYNLKLNNYKQLQEKHSQLTVLQNTQGQLTQEDLQFLQDYQEIAKNEREILKYDFDYVQEIKNQIQKKEQLMQQQRIKYEGMGKQAFNIYLSYNVVFGFLFFSYFDLYDNNRSELCKTSDFISYGQNIFSSSLLILASLMFNKIIEKYQITFTWSSKLQNFLSQMAKFMAFNNLTYKSYQLYVNQLQVCGQGIFLISQAFCFINLIIIIGVLILLIILYFKLFQEKLLGV